MHGKIIRKKNNSNHQKTPQKTIKIRGKHLFHAAYLSSIYSVFSFSLFLFPTQKTGRERKEKKANRIKKTYCLLSFLLEKWSLYKKGEEGVVVVVKERSFRLERSFCRGRWSSSSYKVVMNVIVVVWVVIYRWSCWGGRSGWNRRRTGLIIEVVVFWSFYRGHCRNWEVIKVLVISSEESCWS